MRRSASMFFAERSRPVGPTSRSKDHENQESDTHSRRTLWQFAPFPELNLCRRCQEHGRSACAVHRNEGSIPSQVCAKVCYRIAFPWGRGPWRLPLPRLPSTVKHFLGPD
jgi:hypothetical protein